MLHPAPSSAGFRVVTDGAPGALAGAVVALGNFDGVHLGHQRLIAVARRLADQAGRPAAVLTFEPHPRLFFDPGASLPRLTPLPEKLRLLRAFVLDGAFVRRFDETLAAMSAEAFVEELLVGELKVSGVVAGHDFRFGRGREGTPDRLVSLSRARGLAVEIVSAVAREGRPVSSSLVRQALAEGRVAEANGLLGYRWFVGAEVRHGEKRGRVLGYPTANMALDPTCPLRHGIYAVRGRLADGDVRAGVASFGRRPTFDDGAPLLETFFFDFAGDLYGREITVEFVGWIRGEERFAGPEALVERMHRDADEARGLLAAARDDGLMSLVGG